VTFSCAERVSVSVTFTDSQSFLQLPGATSRSSGVVSAELQFRTWNKAGLLLTFDLLQQEGTVWLHLSEGRLRLQINKAGRVQLELSTGKRGVLPMLFSRVTEMTSQVLIAQIHPTASCILKTT